uniref:Uncharacterized protein n=1 Tax=Hyaloperonospora arabidopsidis (strain Emoy2) TaxID=559515 RepID=M4BFW7_HYAAE
MTSCFRLWSSPQSRTSVLPAPSRDNVQFHKGEHAMHVWQIEHRGHLDPAELGGSYDKHGIVGHRLPREPCDMCINETKHVTQDRRHGDLMAEG